MDASDAIRIAAEHSCDMEWDDAARGWTIFAVSYDADPCSLDPGTLDAIDEETFIRDFIPDRFDTDEPPQPPA